MPPDTGGNHREPEATIGYRRQPSATGDNHREPEAKLRLYIGGNVEAMLDDTPPSFHASPTR